MDLVIDQLNLLNLDWELTPDVEINRALSWAKAVALYDKIISDSTNACFCKSCAINDTEPFNKDCCKSLNAPFIATRIGSESKDAEVYLIQGQIFKGKEMNGSFALKVMPIMGTDSKQKNENEIKISLLASSLVEQSISRHFLRSLGHSYCSDTNYSPASKLFIPSLEWAKRNFMIKAIERGTNAAKIKRLGMLRKRIISEGKPDLIERIMELDPRLLAMSEPVERLTLESDLLFLELAASDLISFIRINADLLNKNENHWIIILTQMLKAVADMQNYLGVIHNDLHLGNWFVTFDDSPERIVLMIGDFGRSAIIGDAKAAWTNEQRKLDISYSLYQLREFIPDGKIRELLDAIMESIADYDGDGNISQAIYEDIVGEL